MKNSIIKHSKLWALSAFVLTLFTVLSCGNDDDQVVTPEPEPVAIATVTAYDSNSGAEGTEVIISGTNFSILASENKAWFNGVEAVIKTVSSTSIKTSVPVGATTGPITVSVSGAEAVSGPNFTVLQPVISSLSVTRGLIGDTVVLTGENFNATPEKNKVWFNNVEATVTDATKTTLTVTVPVGASTGNITVQVNGGAVITGPSFEVATAIIITSLSPVAGNVGETVVITGENFSATAAENKVWFNGVETTVTEATTRTLTVTVPAGATTGAVSVQVKDSAVITGPSFEVTIGITVQVALSHPDDDVEETAGPSADLARWPIGYMELGSSDLEIGELDGDFGVQVIGVRFRGVNIPAGATILSASIVFMCDDTGAGPANMRIHGEDEDSSAEYTTALFNVSSRTKTTASVLWSIAPWVTVGDKGPDQTTADLKDIVQEIVNRGGWAANNNMNFIMTQEGANSPTGGNGREAETFGGAGQEAEAPVLTIVYE